MFIENNAKLYVIEIKRNLDINFKNKNIKTKNLWINYQRIIN